MINSTEYLQLMTTNNVGAVLVKADPSRFKKEVIYLGTADRCSLGFDGPLGLNTNAIEFPREIFDDFIAASLIQQDGQEDAEGRTFYRLTEDGLARGKISAA